MKRELVYGVTTAAVLLTLGSGAALVSCDSVQTLYGSPPADEPVDSETDEPIPDLYGSPPVDEPVISERDKKTPVLYGPPVGYDVDETEDSTPSVSSDAVAK